MKKWIAVTTAVLLLTLSLAGCGGGASYSFDEENMHLVQFDAPADDAPVAVVTTNYGVVDFVLFPEEAPVACENFIELVEQGFYDGTEFFRIEPEIACIAGSTTTDGLSPTTIYDGQKFENEYTSNMWAFSGAVGTISDEEGKSDSRFFLIGNAAVTDEYVELMQSYGFPQQAIDKFVEVGGVPPFTQRYTFFGQIVQGLDVVNQIIALEVNDDQYPTGGAVTIESIRMSTYGEIKS